MESGESLLNDTLIKQNTTVNFSLGERSLILDFLKFIIIF